MVRIPFGRLGLLLLAAAAAAPALSAQGPRPATHTVRSGDTLWDLARRYLGDPFLWPEIFRLNTAVVEDPHWIYPDEVLRISPDGDVASVPSLDTPPPARDSAPQQAGADSAISDDWKKYFVNTGDGGTTIGGIPERPYRALRSGEFYSSGFLTEGRSLPFGELLGRVTPLQIAATATRETANLYTEVLVRAPNGAAYRAGDSLLIVRLGGAVSGLGRMVIPTGMARVTDVAPGRTVASIIEVYGDIAAGDRLLPVEKFVESGEKHAAPVADGVQARVVGSPLQQILTGPQDVLFLDKGRRDGLATGDMFEVRRAANRRPDGAINAPEVMALLQVVRVGERSATARVLTVVSPRIVMGTGSRQIAKLPS